MPRAPRLAALRPGHEGARGHEGYEAGPSRRPAPGERKSNPARTCNRGHATRRPGRAFSMPSATVSRLRDLPSWTMALARAPALAESPTSSTNDLSTFKMSIGNRFR